MAKLNKQVIIDAIIKEVELGSPRGKVVAKYSKKFQKSERTIDGYWKEANLQYKALQDKAKEAADEVYIQSMADAALGAVISKSERLKILSDMARGESRVKAGDVDNPVEILQPIDISERIKAIAEINKMQGDYAETAIKLKGDKENPLFDISRAKVIFE